jgi:hypothetical protein
MSTMFELIRIAAYFVITCAGAYLFFDDQARGRGSRFVWLAIGFEHVAMLLLLALDLQYVADWIAVYRVLWIFTPMAAYVALATLIVAAVAMLGYAVRRYIERKRAKGILREEGI